MSFQARSVVVERRACDVCIVGHSPSAYYAAQLLRTQRNSVILVERLGLPHVEPYLAHAGLISTHVPDVDPALYGIAASSAPMWRQLYDFAGAVKKIIPCASLDCGPVRDEESDAPSTSRPTGPSADADPRQKGKEDENSKHAKQPRAPPRIRASNMQRLVQTCELLGIPSSPLTAAQVAAMYTGLTLFSKEHVALQCSDAAAMQPRETLAILRAMARKMGTDVRERCRLVGFRDVNGSSFELKISEETKEFDLIAIEAEQIIFAGSDPLLPALLNDALGVSFAGLAPYFAIEGRAVVPPGLSSKIPLLRFHRDLKSAERPDLQGGWSTALPRPGLCEFVLDPPCTSDGWHDWAHLVRPSQSVAEDEGEASSAQEAAERDAKRKEAQAQRQAALQLRLTQAEAGVSTAMKGRSSSGEKAPAPLTSQGIRERAVGLVSADGRPLLGALPGVEAGRIVVASCAMSPASPPWSEVRLGPLVGQWAAKMAMAVTLPDGAVGAFKLDREALGMSVGPPKIDSWGEWDLRFRAKEKPVAAKKWAGTQNIDEGPKRQDDYRGRPRGPQ